MATLVDAIGPNDNTIVVSEAIARGTRIRIDDELLDVSGFMRFPLVNGYRPKGLDPTHLRVNRGVGASVRAAHDAGATITAAVSASVSGENLTPPVPFADGGGEAGPHASSHEDGGADELDVTGLVGLPAAGVAVLEDPGNVWEANTAWALGHRFAYTDPTHGARVHVFEVTTAGTTANEADFAEMLSPNREELQPGGVLQAGSELMLAYVGIVGALPADSPAFATLPRGVTWTVDGGLAIDTSADASDQDPVIVISESTGLEIFRLTSGGDGDWTARAGSIITLRAIGDGGVNTVRVQIEDDEGSGGTVALSSGGTRMVAVENDGGTKGLAFFGNAPTTQPAAIADATDPASTQARLNDVLAALRDLGLIATAE